MGARVQVVATEFVRWVDADTDALVGFLTGEDWPFHAGGRPAPADVRERVASGVYDGPDSRTYWIFDGGVRAGLVRLFDLADDNVEFDLRIGAAHRNRGLGTAAVRWLTGYVFGELPHVHRIEATTRSDNWPMRRVLDNCGYQQESWYRESWPAADGVRHDAAGYAVLRPEWAPEPGAHPG
jgi:RimJ/RimL family protein N-acetyltransferase